jgi:hypothetical protein
MLHTLNCVEWLVPNTRHTRSLIVDACLGLSRKHNRIRLRCLKRNSTGVLDRMIQTIEQLILTMTYIIIQK